MYLNNIKNPLVSVIIPCYNAEQYVAQAIQSIISQSYKNLEIIIVDDCSTDSTLEILVSYQAKDNRVRLVKNDYNKGLVTTLNEAFEKATGTLIARMDADDVAHNRRIEIQVSEFEKNSDLLLCGTYIDTFTEDGKRHRRVYPVTNEEIKVELLYSASFAHPTVMLNGMIFRDSGLKYDENFKYAEDYRMWVSLSQVGQLYNIPIKLLDYRILTTSQTGVSLKNSTLREKTIKSIQNIALSQANISLSGLQKEFHYMLSNSSLVVEIDFEKYNYKFIAEYFDIIKNQIISNKYSLPKAVNKILGIKFLKIFLFNKKKANWITWFQNPLIWYGMFHFIKSRIIRR